MRFYEENKISRTTMNGCVISKGFNRLKMTRIQLKNV